MGNRNDLCDDGNALYLDCIKVNPGCDTVLYTISPLEETGKRYAGSLRLFLMSLFESIRHSPSKVQFKNILHVDYHCLVFLLLW